MPDGDVISRGIGYAWRSAYEGLQAMEQPEVVAGRLGKAISRTLRVSEGSKSFNAYLGVVQRVRAGELSEGDAYSEIRNTRVEGDSLRHVAAQAARRCIAGPVRDVDPAHEFAHTLAAEIAEVHLLGKAGPRLVGDGIADPDVADRYLRDCRNALVPDIEKLANQIAQNPEGKDFRAPPHRRKKKSIEQLLDEPLA